MKTATKADEISKLLAKLAKAYPKHLISMLSLDPDEAECLRIEIAEANETLDQPASWHSTAHLMDAKKTEDFNYERMKILRLLRGE